MIEPGRAADLRAALDAADYRYGPVAAALGEAGMAGLGRNQTMAATVALAGRDDPLATLTRLFVLQQPQPRSAVAAALGDLGSLAPIVETDHASARALVDVRPYGSPDDGADGWLVSDLTPGLDGPPGPMRPDYVLGASPASTTLAQITPRTPVGRALDLGTGCGVQSLHLARHCERVVATDILPRALDMARLTFALSGVAAELRQGSLYEPVGHEPFDLIVSNPPFVIGPSSPDPLTYREGSLPGDELVRRVIVDGCARLAPGGSLQVLANWAIPRGGGWQERLAGWVPAGYDALIMERERLDRFAYTEMWLADAGLLGRGDYAARYADWLAYLDAQRIDEVGMGWLFLHRVDSGRAAVVDVQSWPHAVAQPVGAAFAALPGAWDRGGIDDPGFLARAWIVADDVDCETIAIPGAEDPRHIVLRQRTGFLRATAADTALAGVVGACDGELPLGAIVDAVAALLDADPGALTERLLPRLRELVAAGMLS